MRTYPFLSNYLQSSGWELVSFARSVSGHAFKVHISMFLKLPVCPPALGHLSGIKDRTDLARIMHKFFTAAPKPSALTALPLAQAPRRAVQHVCSALGRAPSQDSVFDASLQKPMHNPG